MSQRGFFNITDGSQSTASVSRGFPGHISRGISPHLSQNQECFYFQICTDSGNLSLSLTRFSAKPPLVFMCIDALLPKKAPRSVFAVLKHSCTVNKEASDIDLPCHPSVENPEVTPYFIENHKYLQNPEIESSPKVTPLALFLTSCPSLGCRNCGLLMGSYFTSSTNLPTKQCNDF